MLLSLYTIITLLITFTLTNPILKERFDNDSADLEPRWKTDKCLPLKCKDGYLAVYAKNGSSLGFVSKVLKPEFSPDPTWARNTYTVGPFSSALIVTLPSTDPTVLAKVFNIKTIKNEQDSSLPWFGAAEFDNPVGKGSAGFALLTATGVDTTPKPASLPTENGNPGESLIWTLDCKTEHLVPIWINNDGSKFKAELFYILKGNGDSNGGDGLGLYGDPLVVANSHFLANIPVNIKFIPL